MRPWSATRCCIWKAAHSECRPDLCRRGLDACDLPVAISPCDLPVRSPRGWPRARHPTLPRCPYRFRARWKRLHEQYGKQMAQVIEECTGDNNELRRRRIAALQSTYRSLLLETYEGEDCLFGPVMSPPDRLLLEASAIYHVTYQAARGRQEAAAAAAPAPSVAEHTAARALPVMGAGGPMRQPAAASGGSSQRPSQRAHTGTGLSFVWAVAGDFLELIKCRAMQFELCSRRGEHTAPKMYMAKNMRLLLSKR